MIYTRKDGTYIIKVNNMDYQVIESDEKYWSEVKKRISDGEPIEQYIPPSPNPSWVWNIEKEEWEPDFEEKKIDTLSKITAERNKRVVSGFTYKGKQIACDNVSQANVNAFLTSDLSGILIYPVKWRTVDNSIIEIADSAELKLFAETMLGYVQTIFQESWEVKDNIENTTTTVEVEDLYKDYMEGK